MKRYQVIMPLALPIALAASVYYTVDQRMAAANEYRGYLQAAEQYAQHDLLDKAVASYQKALELNPTADTYLAVGNLYLEYEKYNDAAEWYSGELLENCPEDIRTYEFGIRTELAQENIREAFQVYDEAQDRGMEADALQEWMQPVWYSFELVGDYDDVAGFSESGLAAVRREDKWGYINTSGNRVLNYSYTQAGPFGNLAPVVDGNGEACFVDTSGNKQMTTTYFLEKDPDFGQIRQFGAVGDNVVPAYNGKVWNYYDGSTYEKKAGGYAQATGMSNGVAAVSQDGKTWALLSADGQQLTDFVFEEVLADDTGAICRSDAIIVRQDGSYHLVDRTGQPIGSATYEEACAFQGGSLAAVKKAGHWLLVSPTGEEREVGYFQQLQSVSGGVAAARSDGKWGYIDGSGNWVIEPQFEEVKGLQSTGVAFVKPVDGKWQLLKLYRMNHS